MQYRHLTLEEREWIFNYKEQGYSNREIGRLIGRHHTTISREIKRNAPYLSKYIACRAHTRATNRAIKGRRVAALKSPDVYLYVREHLRLRWSPEMIAGRLPLDLPGRSIHFETIYRYIYKPINKRYGFRDMLTLKRERRVKKHGRGTKRRGTIPGAVSIELRPKVVERRKQFGHWETDNMQSSKGSKTALSASIERKTRYIVLSKLKNQTAAEKADAVISRLLQYPVRTVTADNGKENSYHKQISTNLAADIYFCHAYASWEKGSVENGIKRVRRYVPKGTNLRYVSKKDISLIEKELNSMPMQCLGWLTPSEIMEQELSKLHRN